MSTEDYTPIEDYGVIGNLHTIALVSLKGSIDYLPFMRIDSPTVFVKLLDNRKGGQFSIFPANGFIKSSQFYLKDTNILITRFHTQTGIAELTDYMPVNEQEFNCAVIRQLRTVKGKVDFLMECVPAFNYARSKHVALPEQSGCLFTSQNSRQTAIRLTTSVSLHIKDDCAYAQFGLNENEECFFLFEAAHSTSQRTGDINLYLKTSFKSTYSFWKQWISKCNYQGPWKDEVVRSSLALKLLISHTYGAPVAAATFGLPEAIGGERNWDYRYTWIRDAAFTMYVFMEMGFYDEADKFIEWIKQQCTKGNLQLLYAVDGSKNLEETELNHLEGYKQSKPVRIGNGAYNQLQIDMYGELLDTVYIFVNYARPITIEFWQEIKKQIDIVIDNWKLPDSSIWEVRGGKQEFLFSRLMCWVALDRAIKIAEHCSFPYPEEHWKKVRNEIYNSIFENFWNPQIESFVQYKGSNRTDASMLLMPLVNFISPYSAYWQSTIKAIENELALGVLIYRYKDDSLFDKFRGSEGSFTICSFWYVECLAKSGQAEKAMLYFEKLSGYANHLGLYAEQIGLDGRHLGNFPQAFTHLSLISAAIELTKKQHLQKKVLPPDNASGMI